MHDLLRSLALFVLAMGLGIATPSTASALDPVVVFETAKKLETFSLDADESFAADGQLLEREGLVARFSEGTFRALKRDDGRIIGLVFEGAGELEARIPAGDETASWQGWTDFSPLAQPFNAAYLRFSDFTADDLQGERAWSASADADGSAFRVVENRTALLDEPQWTRRAPALLMDRLMDLYGGGAVGGHLLAEFRLAGDGPATWLSYYHNPRGALMQDETTAWYRARRRGGAPPLLTVLASWGQPAVGAQYDVGFTDLDVTMPTKGGRDVSHVVVKAELGLVALDPHGVKAVMLELESQRKLCLAQPDSPYIKVKKVTDQDGNSLAAVHRKNRLFIPLGRTLQRGDPINLTIEYEGPMTQGIPTGPPDTMFSELGPWAWYPRNPRLDRFASKVSLHLPRFIRGVAPGDLTEEREEKDGWHYTFEEAGGVRNLVVVVGDFVKTKDKFQGANPRVIAWIPRDQQETVTDVTESTRNMLNVIGGMWGPYPYSTLHIVGNSGYPFNNWQFDGDGAAGNWQCLPNDYAHPWEPYVDRPSGMLLGSVISPPSFDVIEERLLENLLTVGVSVGSYIQFVELARQWWGHMVPPKTYRDLWITEALAGWTGLVFLQAGVGMAAVKEKGRTLKDLSAEGQQAGLPLSLGARLDRAFLFQGWGRGTLVMNTLISEVGGTAFLQAINTLINRTSGPGISTEVFVETMEAIGSERVAEVIEAGVKTTALPRIEYVTTIDKDAGEVRMTFTQIDEPLPTSISVQLIWGPKQKEMRNVRLNGPITEVTWPLPDLPKRVVVDPSNLALAKSIKKGKEPTE